MEKIINVLNEESKGAAEKRHKLDIQKSIFVTTLLGFGSIKFSETVTSYQVLYFAPLIAIFYDLLIMGQHYLIKRNNAFIRLYSTVEIDQSYRSFISNYRDNFFKYGSRGFTYLSILASWGLFWIGKVNLKWYDYSWFCAMIVVYTFLLICSLRLHRKMDYLKK